MHRFTKLALPFAIVSLVGCAGTAHKPITTVDYVDLPRFMGDWYVIAHIPTFIEDEAYNAVESYRLTGDNKVATTFTFRHGGFDGPRRTYEPTGYVRDSQSNAVWGMQFVWPIKAEYRIVHLDPEYSETIIGRSKRDYVWLMTRSPQVSEKRYQRLVGLIEQMGYEPDQLRRVPQNWTAPQETSR